MKTIKSIITLAILISIPIVLRIAGNEIRRTSQTNQTLYGIIIATDLITFTQNGGGPVGYDNYYKWVYAKWRADPKRTTFEKIMFWNAGFFYDATNPPEEYKYPFLL